MSIEYKLRTNETEEEFRVGSVEEVISNLVKVNPGQMSFDEYLYIFNLIQSKNKPNVLIFGIGKDSGLWWSANNGGKTIFLEDNLIWIQSVRQGLNQVGVDIDTRPISYTGIGYDAVSLLEDYKNGSDNLRVDLPNDIRDINWDIILVDAPAGYGNDMPCRMKSIYESYELSNDSTDILVHDCEREIEDMYITYFFRDHILLKEFNDGKNGELKHFRKSN